MFTARMSRIDNESTWAELCSNNITDIEAFWRAMRNVGYSSGRISVYNAEDKKTTEIPFICVDTFFNTLTIFGICK